MFSIGFRGIFFDEKQLYILKHLEFLENPEIQEMCMAAVKLVLQYEPSNVTVSLN